MPSLYTLYTILLIDFICSLYKKHKTKPQQKKQVPAKTTKEVIEFYYEWKKTSHYKHWKKSYVMDERDLPPEE
jgi:hypothetical protein